MIQYMWEVCLWILSNAQIRELDANIRWNEIENVHLPAKTKKESKKSIEVLKNAVVRRRRQEGETVKYLVDIGRSRLVPDILLRYGSLLQDPSSRRKKYWLEERHVPLHLLKTYEEKKVVRVAKKDASREHPESSAQMVEPLKKKGFDYLFERAERLERSNCSHCYMKMSSSGRNLILLTNFSRLILQLCWSSYLSWFAGRQWAANIAEVSRSLNPFEFLTILQSSLNSVCNIFAHKLNYLCTKMHSFCTKKSHFFISAQK